MSDRWGARSRTPKGGSSTAAAAAAALNADQVFATAPSLVSEIGLIGPEYDMVGLEYETSFYDQVANSVADLGFTDLAGHLPL